MSRIWKFGADIDTDQIVPGRYAPYMRPNDDVGNAAFIESRPDFNKQAVAGDIIVATDNFGCGSSREHAVWGLRQLGIAACIGTSFAGIFYDNARKNGLALPIVPAEVRDALLKEVSRPAGREVTIDLHERLIQAGEISAPFEMDAATQSALIRGRDDTLDSLDYAAAIRAFESGLSDDMRIRVLK